MMELFLQKYLTTFSRRLFLQKGFIIIVWQNSKYALLPVLAIFCFTQIKVKPQNIKDKNSDWDKVFKNGPGKFF